MDTYREYIQLNEYWEAGNPPWLDLKMLIKLLTLIYKKYLNPEV